MDYVDVQTSLSLVVFHLQTWIVLPTAWTNFRSPRGFDPPPSAMLGMEDERGAARQPLLQVETCTRF